MKEKYKDLINQRQKESKFKEGDKVWLYAKVKQSGYNPKLLEHWHGPFTIIRMISNTMVKLKNKDNRILKNPIHISRLKPYKSMDVPMNQPRLTDENMTYEDEYEVERIVDIRSSHGKRQYLIKWKGYKDSDNTWEPIENLTHCQDMIKEFHREKGLYCDNCSYLALNDCRLREHRGPCESNSHTMLTLST